MVTPRRALIQARNNDVVTFDPERFKLKVAALDFTIKEARRIKDWPTLEKAVDEKMEQLHCFVNWWTLRTRGAGNPTGNNQWNVELAQTGANSTKHGGSNGKGRKEAKRRSSRGNNGSHASAGGSHEVPTSRSGEIPS